MKTELYFALDHDEERCYSILYWKQYMDQNFIDSLVLHVAQPQKVSGVFWCKEFQSVGEKGEGCGSEYEP